MQRSLIAVVLAAALLLASGGTAAEGPYPGSDAAIGAAVQLVLWRERSLAGADIRVEAAEGEVTLRGFASTMEDIATAGRLARAIPGVRGVFNAIRVSVRPSRA
jgi:osmotically-inducible protein OsmY